MVVGYMERNKGTYSEQHRSYYLRHRDILIPKLKVYCTKYRNKLKEDVLQHYGGSCFCCQENNKAFLTIDHIHNNGAEQRTSLFGKNIGGGYRFYLWLKKNNWPEGFQVACFNCNQGRANNGGICPHKGEKQYGGR
jgi:hypothetical protein